LAGALASHYVAARENASEGAEANALGGQARLALRGAAERASALGAREQALGFYRQAIAVTPDPAELADLHERAARSAELALHWEEALELLTRAIELYRGTGDRLHEAKAIANLATSTADNGRPEEALVLLNRAGDEIGDLAESEAGARLMVALARVHGSMDEPMAAASW